MDTAISTILHIDSSARYAGSFSRILTREVVGTLQADNPGVSIIRRDLADGAEFIDEAWVLAQATLEEDRTTDQHKRLSRSDELVDELFRADTIVIGAPIYNFAIPAALKAWIDLVARARKTFRYTDDGPRGLLTGKRAIVVVTSAGTEIDSEIDFATGYLRHILGFLGISDVTVIPAGRLMFDTDQKLAAVRAMISRLPVLPSPDKAG